MYTYVHTALVVGTIKHGYNTVEHNVTDANNCTGANYYKVPI